MPASLEGLAGRRRLGCRSAGGGQTGASHFGKEVFQQCVKGNFPCTREEEQRSCALSQIPHAMGLDHTYYFTRPTARLPLLLLFLFLFLTYPNQLLRKGSSGVFWHVDRWDDPVSLLPPQAVSAVMLAPREQSVALLLRQFSGHSLPSFWLFWKRESKTS